LNGLILAACVNGLAFITLQSAYEAEHPRRKQSGFNDDAVFENAMPSP